MVSNTPTRRRVHVSQNLPYSVSACRASRFQVTKLQSLQRLQVMAAVLAEEEMVVEAIHTSLLMSIRDMGSRSHHHPRTCRWDSSWCTSHGTDRRHSHPNSNVFHHPQHRHASPTRSRWRHCTGLGTAQGIDQYCIQTTGSPPRGSCVA